MANKELADGQPPKKKSKFKWFLLFLFFLILLGAGAAGAWIFLLDGTLPDFLQRRDSAPARPPPAPPPALWETPSPCRFLS